MRAVFNTEDSQSRRLHAVLLLSMVDCWGCRPSFKAPAYRSQTVIDPRGVLAEFGVSLPEGRRSVSGIRRRNYAISSFAAAGAPRTWASSWPISSAVTR